jgi:ADP-heptose:LPS heptosyltransferase/hemerythrin superfamily protein
LSPPGWEGVRRVLAVRLDNVGDVVMLGPALRAVRRGLPGATVTLLCSPAGSQAAPLLAEVDDVLVHRAVWQDASGSMPLDPARELALVDRLRDGRHDAALVFTSFGQTPHTPAYACYLAGIPIRVGESKEFGGSVLSVAAPPLPDAAHQVDRNVHLVEAAGFAADGRHLALRLPPGAGAAAAGALAGAGVDPGRPYAVVAPGASAAARRYPAERFAAVVAGLADLLPVVVAGSERERALVGEVAGDRGAALAGRTSVAELAAAVAGAALVVCNNSGPLHLADAFAVPQVVLYSGTDLVTQWEPRSSPAEVLRRDVWCSPCYRFRCPYDLGCVDVPPAEVLAAARRLLARVPLATGGYRAGMDVDIIELLTTQHREVEQRWTMLQEARQAGTGGPSGDLGREIVALLSGHDALETRLLYPELRAQDGDEGRELAEHGLEEHEEVRELLSRMDGKDPADEAVFATFQECLAAVMAHVQEEEGRIFPLLRASVGQDRLLDLGRQASAMDGMAPTHPHPHTPDGTLGATVADRS